MSIRTKVTYAFEHGCGFHIIGGTYLISNLSKHAPEVAKGQTEKHALAYFMQDPPIVVDPASLGMSAQGLSFIRDPRTGIVNVWDWIGKTYYANAADLWEEMAGLNPDGTMHGGSALAQITDDWNQLVPGVSKRILVHPHGFFGNPAPYREHWVEIGLDHCMLPELKPDGTPSDRKMHLSTPTQMCAALWWQCLEDIKVTRGTERMGVRTCGSTSYAGGGPIKGEDPKYQPAIIGWLPIDEVHVIGGDIVKNPADINEKIKQTLRRLQNMTVQLPIFLTNA